MTPNPTPPQQPQASGLFSIIGPLIGGFAGDNGSLRRFVLGAAGVAAVAGNHKLGLGLDTTELVTLSGLIATLVLGSNVKEVQKAKVDAQAQAVALVPDVAAAVVELRKGPTPSNVATEAP